MKITPEEAEKMGRKAQALEEGFEGSVLAGRPPGLRLPEMILEHEMRQRGVRRLAIASNAASIVAIGVSAVGGSPAILVLAAGSGLLGLGLLVAAARRERLFESKVRELAVPRSRAIV